MINDGCLLSCAETDSDDKGIYMRAKWPHAMVVPLWVLMGQVVFLEARYVYPPRSPYFSAYPRQDCLFTVLSLVIFPVCRLV